MTIKLPRIAPIDPARRENSLGSLKGQGDNLYLTLMNHPVLHQKRLELGQYLQKHSTLDDFDRELLILRIAWRCQSPYIWGRHVGISQKAGIVEAISFSTRETIETDKNWLLMAVDELYGRDNISEATWNELSKSYSTQQIMDIVFTVGGYRMLAMACKSFGVEPEEGDALLPDW